MLIYLLGVLVLSKVSTSTPLDLITFSELFPLGKQSELTIFAPHSPKQAVSGLVAMPHLSRWKNRGKHAARIPKSLPGPWDVSPINGFHKTLTDVGWFYPDF